MNVMMYTNLVEGWSRGLVDRPAVLRLLGATCRRTHRCFGMRGGVSLGVVGTGAFGDEPRYRDPRELAADVAAARAAGIEGLALLDLGGVLSGSPPEPWLDAFTS